MRISDRGENRWAACKPSCKPASVKSVSFTATKPPVGSLQSRRLELKAAIHQSGSLGQHDDDYQTFTSACQRCGWLPQVLAEGESREYALRADTCQEMSLSCRGCQ